MKILLKRIGLTAIGLSIIFLLANCGGGTSTNEYLGKLPGIAEKYSEKIDSKEKEIKACTDMAKAFKLDAEKNELEDEADNAIKECLTNNPLNALPYEQKADYPFTIQEVFVNAKNSSSISRLQLTMKVEIDEDIKNKTLFAYINAVDKEGNSLIKRPGVFSSGFRSQDFTKGQEAELTGSIDGVKDLEKFEKFIFISREEYNKLK